MPVSIVKGAKVTETLDVLSDAYNYYIAGCLKGGGLVYNGASLTTIVERIRLARTTNGGASVIYRFDLFPGSWWRVALNRGRPD